MKKTLYALAFFVLSLVSLSCQPEEALVTQQYYTVIKSTLDPGYPLEIEKDSLRYVGSLTKLGSLPILKYGICYGLNAQPTLNDNVVVSSTPIDSIPYIFSVKLKNLKPQTTYQVRSFAVTEKDTVYSVNNFFRTYGPGEWAKRELMVYPQVIKDPKDRANTYFSNENKIFLLYNQENYLWEYDTRRYNWLQRKTIPSTLSTGATKYSFMIGDKGFCGNFRISGNESKNEFWQYDSKGDSWSSLNNTPTIVTNQVFSFTNGKFGFLLNQNATNGWNFWKFDPTTNVWSNIAEVFKNTVIKNLISDGLKTHVITSSGELHSFDGTSNWNFTESIQRHFPNQGQLGYYSYAYKDKIYIGEYIKASRNISAVLAMTDILETGTLKELNLNNKEVRTVENKPFISLGGAFQMQKKLFFSSIDEAGATPDTYKTRLSEFYPFD